MIFLARNAWGGTLAAVCLPVVMAAGPALAQSTLDATVQAQINAAQARAAAAMAQADAQVAEAQARIDEAARKMATGQNSGGWGNNTIRVTGNHAGKVVVECHGEPATEVNVNSVVADGKSLRGKTVIVAGRNARDVELRGNCRPASSAASKAANVNSVIIR